MVITKIGVVGSGKGKATEELKAQTLERLYFSNDIESLTNADLIIEAIVEKLDLYQRQSIIKHLI